jgi:hypothetical protein
MAYRSVPPDLYRHVEPEAGEVLPVSRWRHREEFLPNWAYIYSPRASVEAVVAALSCTTYVYEENWTKALGAHAPAALKLLAEKGCTLRQYCQGEIPVGLGPRVDAAINEALGGYNLIVLFPAPDALVRQGAAPEH